ncbi:hypothetical protein O988_07323, partial [Pseudogymnoascus sp. VKM F-3808]
YHCGNSETFWARSRLLIPVVTLSPKYRTPTTGIHFI